MRLLEREEQLALVGEALDAAAVGHGAALAIEGAAGLGKTALLDAAANAATERGLRVLRARGLELEVEHPFGAVRQLLDPVLRGLDAGAGDKLLRGAAGLARPALSGREPPAAGAGEFGALHGLYWLTAELAGRSPLALLVDDAQWLDGPSARLVTFLAPRLDGLALALVVAARPGGVPALPAGVPVAHPRPLSEGAVTQLVRKRLGLGETTSGEQAGLGTACAEASAGNPFYLAQLLGELEREPRSATAQRVRALAPSGVARAVLLRLARLGSDATALARAVAVLGDGATLPVVAELSGLEPPAARAAADALVEADLFTPTTDVGFAHPLVRRAVYDDVAPFERSGAHRRAARLLEGGGASAEAVAAQLLDAAPEGEPWAVAALRRAATGALRRGAPAIAAGLLERALREPPTMSERPGLLLEAAEAQALAGRHEAADHFGELLTIDPSPAERVRAATGLGRLLTLGGRPDEAIDLLEREHDRLGGEGELPRAVLAELLSIAQVHPRRRPRLAARLADLRERALPADSRPARRLLGMQAGEHLLAYGSADAVLASARAALAGGRLLAEETADSPTYHNVLNVLSLAGWCDEADGLRDQAVADARARGSVLGYALSSGFRGVDRLRAGRLADAEADLRSGIEPIREHWPPGVSLLSAFLVEVLVARGALAQARTALDDLGSIDEQPGAWDEVRFAARGRLRLAEGDVSGAAADLLRSTRIWEGFGVENWMLDADCVVALARDGRRELATELAERELAGARRCGAPRPLGMALRAAALVGERERAIDLLLEAVATLEGTPLRLERALATNDLGAAMRRAGRRVDARGPLAEGLDLALACGAEPLAAVARSELEAVGVRARSIVRRGVDALTPSERRVAEMAAEGMQNREIAQALFVTVKTVETQLSSTYRKVGISSRRELARALQAPHG